MHHQARTPTKTPTHADVTTFLEVFLPPSLNPATKAREVPYLYHTVRNRAYSLTTQLTSRVVFSITPTSGVYAALHASNPRYKTPICFVHRPFDLDRHRVSHGALVLASHKSFDEHLTVGWNEALARRLRLDMENAVCIRGYKGDDQRKIGLVARLSRQSELVNLAEKVKNEFAGAGELLKPGSQSVPTKTDDDASLDHGRFPADGEGTMIKVIAIMNAFHAEEVERVLSAAHEAGWINDVNDGHEVLYLTGAARQPGIEALKKVKMPAYCVGHAACEEWGIRYLAKQTRERWPGLEVMEVYEEEEPRPDRKTEEGKDARSVTTSQMLSPAPVAVCPGNK